jgi:DNA-binding NarL/FixJ family response regulator
VEAQATTRSRVVVADDDVLLREGLASLLERSDFQVVGQAGNADELIELVREYEPEVVIAYIDAAHVLDRAGGGTGSARSFPASPSSSCPHMSRSSMRRSCSRPGGIGYLLKAGSWT